MSNFEKFYQMPELSVKAGSLTLTGNPAFKTRYQQSRGGKENEKKNFVKSSSIFSDFCTGICCSSRK